MLARKTSSLAVVYFLLLFVCYQLYVINDSNGSAMMGFVEKPKVPAVTYTVPRRLYGEELKDVKMFFDYILNPSVLCRKSVSVGGFPIQGNGTWYTDGNKMICLDPAFGFNEKNCVIYSLGINNEWSFDDQIDKWGCKIYAFDPSMNAKEHKRGKGIHFYPIGVAGEDMIAEQFNNAELKTMPSIVKMLGHQNIDIDYMKIDVEGAEVDNFEQMLDDNPEILDKFKQIGMEIHPGGYTEDALPHYKRLFKMFMRMEKRGFRLIYTAPNPVPGNFYYLEEVGQVVNGFYELVWVKVPPEYRNS